MSSKKVPGKKRPLGHTESDYFHLQIIDGFIATAKAIDKNYLSDPDKFYDNSTSLMPAYIVNATFAIELMFKYEAKAHGYEMTGHDLLFLYDESEQDFKDKIINGLIGKGMISSESDFRSKLGQEKTDFEDWRYAFETDSVPTSEGVVTVSKKMTVNDYFLTDLMDVMRESLTIKENPEGIKSLSGTE